jgi:ABC-type amino acid transport substrate-binding protein
MCVAIVYLAILTRKANAGINDNPVNAFYIFKQNKGKLKVVGDLLTAEYYGIASTKIRPELSEELNEALKTAKKDGTYDKIYTR